MSEPAAALATKGSKPPLPYGLVAVVKRDCPTCEFVVPILHHLQEQADLTVITQDDPAFPADAVMADRRAGAAHVGGHHALPR